MGGKQLIVTQFVSGSVVEVFCSVLDAIRCKQMHSGPPNYWLPALPMPALPDWYLPCLHRSRVSNEAIL